jgi:hypothetical protein
MRKSRASAILVAIAITGGVVAFGASTREADARQSCHKVQGTVTSHIVDPANCPSPVGLCTAGTITGGGPLNGATVFTTLALAPSACLPGVPPTTLSYTGVFQITTNSGTITTTDVGLLDQANLVFTEIDQVQGGTGQFAGATGTWIISGPVIDSGTGFRGEITGELCTP